jgi:16S rRNA (adenine1518-N6/adenine1519-N6)-dimethyltransferase
MKPGEILRELKKFPNKLLGQNFLVDNSAVKAIHEAAELTGDDVVVEIGPGLGSLTWPLVEIVKKVIAIEADREFVHYLRLKKTRKLTVVGGDALKIDWTAGIDGPYKIVANIPYSITSPLLRKIYALESKPELVVLLVQKELAERLIAKPKTRARGFMTVLREANAEAEIICAVKPGSFYPAPQVDSAVIKLTPFAENKMEALFWPIIESGFRHKRQTLANALSADLQIPKADTGKALGEIGLTAMARGEELSFEQWVKLSPRLQSVR